MKKEYRNLLITSVILLLYWLYNTLFSPLYERNRLESIKEKEINSVVKRITIDYDNHGIPYLVFGNDSIIIYRKWEGQITAGDSIIKPKGSLKFRIVGNNKDILFDIELPDF